MHNQKQQETSDDLYARIVKGGGYVLAGKIGDRFINFIKIIIIARLLPPEEFGVFGIVILSVATILAFSQTGFNTALIQHNKDIKGYLDTVWVAEIVRGSIISFLLIIASPMIGWFFNAPRVIPLIQIISFSLVIKGLTNIGIVYFIKDLEFKKITYLELISQLISLIIGVFLAFKLRSAWALVWASLSGELVRCLLSYKFHSYRPKLSFNISYAKDLFTFGRWMFGSSIVIFFALNGDNAFLGKILGIGALGIYQMAFTISNTPATEITNLISSIMMPAYSKIQTDKQRLGKLYLDVFEIIMAITIPLSIFIGFAATEIISAILGKKWADAVIPLQILVIAGFIRALAATAGPVFTGTGVPKLDFFMNVIRVLVMAIAIYPLTYYGGINGTALAVVLSLIATLPIWKKVISVTNINWKDIFSRLWPSLFAGILIIPGILACKLLTYSSHVILLLESFVAVTIYLFFTWIIGIKFQTGLYVYISRLFIIAKGKV